jgi:Co/Zn/Cd efflux system component
VSGGEGHGHEHALPTGAGTRRPLTIVLGISSTILVVEVVGAFISGSLALLADAGHMLTDVAGLSLALVAAVLAGGRPRMRGPGVTGARRYWPRPRRPRCCWRSAGSS